MIESTSNLIMRFVGKEAGKLYFTADTHWQHSKIISYCDRPFSTIEEHDETLIANWKKKVPEDAIVFHLGDVGFGSKERLKEILNELPGKIYLIVGNHDIRMVDYLKDRFEGVFWQKNLQIGKRIVILNHYPFLCYAGVYKQHLNHRTIQLFGHVHTKSDGTAKGLDIPRLDVLFPWQYDVGVDNNNYTPVSWLEIQEIMEKRRQEIIAKQQEI